MFCFFPLSIVFKTVLLTGVSETKHSLKNRRSSCMFRPSQRKFWKGGGVLSCMPPPWSPEILILLGSEINVLLLLLLFTFIYVG